MPWLTTTGTTALNVDASALTKAIVLVGNDGANLLIWNSLRRSDQAAAAAPTS
jgi:hypothetical protein